MHQHKIHLIALLATSAGFFFTQPAHAGWQNKAPFGASLQGDLYTPTTPADSPAILVAIHYCTGNSGSTHGWFDSYAEQNGFYIISPDAGKQCFDASISRDGDPQAVVDMVDWVIAQKGADANRVFAAGLSSGGCMTNTLLAIYPDVFAGGSAMPGFPAGGWPAGDTTCTKCGSSPPSTDGAHWGDMVRAVFSFDGTRPCVQEWVGGGDEYNFNGWLPAVAAEFQNLGGLGAAMPGTGAPNGWTRTEYKDADGNVRLQTNLGPSTQKHDLSSANLWGGVISFLGLDQPTGACGIATTAGTGGTSGTGGADGGTGGLDGGTGGINSAAGGSSSASGGTGAASGGATNGTSSGGGGNLGTGGMAAGVTGGTGSDATPPNDGGGGCSYRGAVNDSTRGFLGLGLVGVGLAFWRRRQSKVS